MAWSTHNKYWHDLEKLQEHERERIFEGLILRQLGKIYREEKHQRLNARDTVELREKTENRDLKKKKIQG